MTVDTDNHLIWLISECFRNTLRHLIRIEPVLDHVTFLSREQKERIMTKARNDGNPDAVNIFIDIIVNGPRPPGWSREFMDALSSAGCTYAAQIVDTEKLPTPSLQAENDYCVQLITILSPSLLKMKTTEVCDVCYQSELITEDDRENILAATANHGSKAGARILLDRIVMKPPGWFSTFLDVLRQTDHPHLVEELTGAKNGLDTDASTEKGSSSGESGGEQEERKEEEKDKQQEEEEQREKAQKEEEEKKEEAQRRGQALILENSVDTSDVDLYTAEGDPLEGHFTETEHPGCAVCGEEGAAATAVAVVDPLTLRPEQLTVAQPALEGHNIIVSMPTGSGKTRIAVYVAKQHLDQRRQQGVPAKVMVIVNKVVLVEQHFRKEFGKFLRHEYRLEQTSGFTPNKQAFANTVAEHDVIICTAQILLNALLDPEDGISLSDITLLVIDECHHTKKGDVYQQIMDLYLSDKLDNIKKRKAGQDEKPLPQILGLTASVGVGKASKQNKAQEHILRICASLDASALMTAPLGENSRNEQLLMAKRRTQDPFGDVLCSLMTRIQEHAQLSPTVAMGTQRYEQWVVEEEKRAACKDDQRRRVCAEHLRQYNEAVIQSNSIRMCDAHRLLLSFYRQEDRKKQDIMLQTDTDKFLFKLFNDNVRKLEELSKKPEYENNVLSMLRTTILKMFSEQDEVRGIIFTETRLSAKALHSWIQENGKFDDVNVRSSYLIGAGDQSAVKPMTASEQRDILRKFNSGEINLLIATSVAEEGLDIERCNVVIRYCLVTSEIAMIQARGRGRAEGSSYIVIGAEGSGVVERERLNKQREDLMKKAIEAIQQMSKETYNRQVMSYQMEGRLEKKVRKKRSEERGRRRVEPSAVKFRCRGCKVVVCGGEDIEVIEDAHHVNLSAGFRAKFNENTNSSRSGMNAHCEAEKYISCQGCGQFWGPVMNHRQLPCPCLNIRGFVVLHGDTEGTFESWNDLNVDFPDFDFYSHASQFVFEDEEDT
ncbi:hypothetical protein ACEWY4_016672 [Coilia grayii]|uniref:RNA helicase n=1 Tax=Coilia grayii TaxID=363190 RepID=A0ABD1JL16_9TELE